MENALAGLGTERSEGIIMEAAAVLDD